MMKYLKINPEGYKFIAIFVAVTFVLFFVWDPLGWVGVVLSLWCAYFFRDPERVVPSRAGLVISPADGLVLPIKKVVPPAELELGEEERDRISIFMNVFDVHVNRAPISGVVKAMHYIPGKFFNASLDKASTDNERQLLSFEGDDGTTIGCVQIAGLVARRIVTQVKSGDKCNIGERFGLIRFGSRVDVYLDPSMKPMVIEGQRTIAGETVLADKKSKEKQREGKAI